MRRVSGPGLSFGGKRMVFYLCWEYLRHHPMVQDADGSAHLRECLDIGVVVINPETGEWDRDVRKNVFQSVWLEFGPYLTPECDPDHDWQHSIGEKGWMIRHDLLLDVWGNTFEECVVDLAHLVKAIYGDENHRRPEFNYEGLQSPEWQALMRRLYAHYPAVAERVEAHYGPESLETKLHERWREIRCSVKEIVGDKTEEENRPRGNSRRDTDPNRADREEKRAMERARRIERFRTYLPPEGP